MRGNEIVRIIIYFTIEKYKGVADARSLIQVLHFRSSSLLRPEYYSKYYLGRTGISLPILSMIQFRMEGSSTLVTTRGVFEAQELITPKLTIPASCQNPLSYAAFLITSETGPPESP